MRTHQINKTRNDRAAVSLKGTDDTRQGTIYSVIAPTTSCIKLLPCWKDDENPNHFHSFSSLSHCEWKYIIVNENESGCIDPCWCVMQQLYIKFQSEEQEFAFALPCSSEASSTRKLRPKPTSGRLLVNKYLKKKKKQACWLAHPEKFSPNQPYKLSCTASVYTTSSTKYSSDLRRFVY